MKQHANYIFAVILFVVLTACGPSQAELDATAAQMAVEKFASQTAAAPTVTPTPIPTNTTTPTLTATITPTATPISTFTVWLEDCIDFDDQQAAVKQIDGRWKILVGQMSLLDFADNEMEARRALQVIQHYHLNRQCFVGRPDPGMEYYLVGVEAPAGFLTGEVCISFNPDALAAVELGGGRWKIVEGGHWILDFDDSKDEARLALYLIWKHGFTKICFVGRPDVSMTYWRR